MEVFSLFLKVKEEGTATVEAALGKLRKSALLTSAAIGTSLALGLRKLAQESSAAQSAQAQLANTIRATGNAAGVSVEGLNAHAAALTKISTASETDINKAQARLLSYTDITGEHFTRATEVVLDYAAAFNTDLVQASEAVGKALNYPTQGLGLLSKQGFIFSEAQKQQIKLFEETNQLAKAQAIIFGELESVTKGAARAQRDTLGGALQGLRNEFNRLFEVTRESSEGIIQAIEGITASLPKLRAAANEAFLAWGILLVDIEIGLARLSKALAESNIRWATFAMNVTRGAVGTGLLADQLGRLTQADADLHALQILKDERQRQLAGAGAAPATAAGAGARVSGMGGALQATKQELDAIRALEDQHFRDAAEAFRTRMDFVDAEAAAVQAVIDQHLRDAREAFMTRTQEAVDAEALRKSIRDSLADGIAGGIVDGIAAGFERGFATGRIGDGFKALAGTMLSGLGSAMVQFGRASLMASTLMKKIQSSLRGFAPEGAIVASLAMIAAGGALRGVAGAAFGGMGGGGGVAVTPTTQFGIPMGGTGPTQLIFGATSATTAAGMTPRQAVNVTLIGPNDPSAQRAMQELLRNANQRGTLG